GEGWRRKKEEEREIWEGGGGGIYTFPVASMQTGKLRAVSEF
ncbi:hypothetical protein VN97_g10534, partial [Penicillium thymicola]